MQRLKNDMWSVLRMPVKSQAAAFWTSCSQGNSDRLSPEKKAAAAGSQDENKA